MVVTITSHLSTKYYCHFDVFINTLDRKVFNMILHKINCKDTLISPIFFLIATDLSFLPFMFKSEVHSSIEYLFSIFKFPMPSNIEQRGQRLPLMCHNLQPPTDATVSRDRPTTGFWYHL